MASTDVGIRLAVLIDGDNVPAKYADAIFKRIFGIGDAQIRRIYGDLAGANGNAWQEAIATHALVGRQHHPLWKAKNAADIALTIDAMDILHSGLIDGFCIVSSDCDFTPLAKRIREAGKPVYGFGGIRALESYRASCREFFALEQPTPPCKIPDLSTDLIRRILVALKDCCAANGWAKVNELGTYLARLDPPVTAKNEGFANLTKLLAETGQFDLERIDGHFRTRQKPKAAASRQ